MQMHLQNAALFPILPPCRHCWFLIIPCHSFSPFHFILFTFLTAFRELKLNKTQKSSLFSTDCASVHFTKKNPKKLVALVQCCVFVKKWKNTVQQTKMSSAPNNKMHYQNNNRRHSSTASRRPSPISVHMPFNTMFHSCQESSTVSFCIRKGNMF